MIGNLRGKCLEARELWTAQTVSMHCLFKTFNCPEIQPLKKKKLNVQEYRYCLNKQFKITMNTVTLNSTVPNVH